MQRAEGRVIRSVRYTDNMGFDNGRLIRATLQATRSSDGATMVNVFHYDLIDSTYPLHDNDPQTLADTLRDALVTPLTHLFSSAWFVQPVTLIEERDPLHPFAPRSGWQSGVPTQGIRTIFGDALPLEATAVATIRTANIGRRARGRTFLPGTFSEGDQAAGVWGLTATAPMQAYLDAIPLQPDIAVGVSTSTANWCVYSRTQRAANLSPYAPHVTSFQLHDRFRWLRSRGL